MVLITGKMCAGCRAAVLMYPRGAIVSMAGSSAQVTDPDRVQALLSTLPYEAVHRESESTAFLPRSTRPTNVGMVTVSFGDGRQERTRFIISGRNANADRDEIAAWAARASREASRRLEQP
jgi:hypothetical protein